MEELECAFGVVGNYLDEQGFNGIYLFGKIWIQNVRDIWFFKWVLLLKIQINSKKTQVLEGKISWGHGKHLGPTAQATH